MTSQPLHIGILGSSTMALPSLQVMLQNKLVTTVGIPSVVHDGTNDIRQLCLQYNTTAVVFQKKTLGEGLKKWVLDNKLDVVLVFTFSWKIPASVLTIPKYGFINFHFGLLPQYRGADAIFWEIKNREPFGGISVHKMDETFDTGNLLHIEKVPITADDTYGMHMAKVAARNTIVLSLILKLIYSGMTEGTPQDNQRSGYYLKPGIKDIIINWEQDSAEEIIALVNACNPWNKGAYAMINNMNVRITAARELKKDLNSSIPGAIVIQNDGNLAVCCKDNKFLAIDVITTEEGIFYSQTFVKQYAINNTMKFKSISIA